MRCLVQMTVGVYRNLRAKWTVTALINCALSVDHGGSYAFFLYFCCSVR
jgi:hypothetical protein